MWKSSSAEQCNAEKGKRPVHSETSLGSISNLHLKGGSFPLQPHLWLQLRVGSNWAEQTFSAAFILTYTKGFPSSTHFFFREVKANLNSAPVEIQDLFSILTFSTQKH